MPEAKRVLHVIGAMDRGGAETLIMNVYRAINRDDIQFDFLVHDERECDYDSEIIGLGGRIFNLFRFNGLNSVSYYRACVRFFSAHHDYISVHVHIGSSAFFVIKAAKRFDLFTIAHSHNTNPPISVMELGFRFFSFPTRYIADAYLACSLQAGIDRFGKRVCSQSNFHVLVNGIDTNAYAFNEDVRNEVRSQLHFVDDDFVFVHVGRFSPEKNHALLLRAFACAHESNSHACLILIGRGPLEDRIKLDVARLGLSDCVKFLGVRDDIPNILMGADAFVFPSQWEGLGISAIEAQASGLPALLSPSLPDIAFVSDRAYRVGSLESPDKWAEAMLGAMGRSNGVKSRSIYAKVVADAGFDINETSNQLVNLYKLHSFGGWK